MKNSDVMSVGIVVNINLKACQNRNVHAGCHRVKCNRKVSSLEGTVASLTGSSVEAEIQFWEKMQKIDYS